MDEVAARFVREVWSTWQAGGWLMLGLAGLSLAIYYAVAEQWRESNRWPVRELLALDEGSIAAFSRMPNEIRGILEASRDDRELVRWFGWLRRQTLQRIDRRLAYLSILVSAAPMTGLLGTVSGLLTTFRGLSAEPGPLADAGSIGIHEAMVTTQTGLIIAIPAFVFTFVLQGRRETWAAAITHVESVALRRMRREAA